LRLASSRTRHPTGSPRWWPGSSTACPRANP